MLKADLPDQVGSAVQISGLNDIYTLALCVVEPSQVENAACFNKVLH